MYLFDVKADANSLLLTCRMLALGFFMTEGHLLARLLSKLSEHGTQELSNMIPCRGFRTKGNRDMQSEPEFRNWATVVMQHLDMHGVEEDRYVQHHQYMAQLRCYRNFSRVPINEL